jgi:hypothetical protein
VAFLLLIGGAARASEPAPGGEARPVPPTRVGSPASVVAESTGESLVGPWDRRQLLVTGRYADGSVRDLTRVAEWSVEPPEVAAVDAAGRVSPKFEGRAVVTARVADRTLRFPIAVSGMADPPPVSFQREVNAVLNRGGCNSGACHGTPTGKGGFHLSLRGWDPAYDHIKLSREGGGRRVDVHQPDESLLLKKPLGAVPHMGGVRWGADSLEHRVLREWIAGGAAADPLERNRIAGLTVAPAGRVLEHPDVAQQMTVTARFADGTVRDVTAYACFSVSNEEVASVDAAGLVVGRGRGEIAVLVRYLDAVESVRMTFLRPAPGLVWSAPPENNFIDRHVFAKLRRLRIPPSDLCGDAEFLRRATLDACGVLPTADEVRAFLADPRPDKRARRIDALLARPEFADFWALKWADVLELNEQFLGDVGVRRYHAWIRKAVADDLPIDRFARELLTAQGSHWENPAAGFYLPFRSAEFAAEGAAQVFLGVRMQCARCHNHPSEQITQDDYYRLAAFFAGVKRGSAKGQSKSDSVGERLITVNPKARLAHPRTGADLEARPLKADAAAPAGGDPRPFLADWLARPDNPYFAKAVVNRVWYHLLGRGIVEPPDDFRAGNPPADDALMDALAADFAGPGGYRLRHAVRTIMNSRVYQLSARTNDLNRDDGVYFSHALPRLLTAEQLLDAVCQVTGVPESFPGHPPGTRAAQLPGTKGNAFLATFNRPARRLACECERQKDANLTQALQLISGRLLHDKLRSGKGVVAELLRSQSPESARIEEVYLAALGRPPTERERSAAAAHLRTASDPREAWEDLVWAVLNSKEFLFRH